VVLGRLAADMANVKRALAGHSCSATSRATNAVATVRRSTSTQSSVSLQPLSLLSVDGSCLICSSAPTESVEGARCASVNDHFQTLLAQRLLSKAGRAKRSDEALADRSQAGATSRRVAGSRRWISTRALQWREEGDSPPGFAPPPTSTSRQPAVPVSTFSALLRIKIPFHFIEAVSLAVPNRT
jgi:hypothetical protein